MTRATMRRILRRRLREVNPDQWTDTDLNEMLAEGVKVIQVEISEVNPNAFLEIDRQDIIGPSGNTPGIQFYPLPFGFSIEHLVEILDPTTSTYKAIERGDFFFLKDPKFLAAANGVAFNVATPPPGQPNPLNPSVTQYARIGRYLFISPPPGQNIAAGLQITFSPTVDFANDTDVSELHVALHYEIILQTHLMLIGETAEGADEIMKAMLPYKGLHSTLYASTGGRPMAVVPQIDKGY